MKANILVFTFAFVHLFVQLQAQKEIARVSVDNQMNQLKVINSWCDEQGYIVSAVKGQVKSAQAFGHLIIFTHPDKGIISQYFLNLDDISFYNFYSSSDNEFVIYMNDGRSKTIRKALVLYKDGKNPFLTAIQNNALDESIFSCQLKGNYLYATENKDGHSLTLYQVSTTGITKKQEFVIADSLMKVLKKGNTHAIYPERRSNENAIGEKKLYVYDDSVVLICENVIPFYSKGIIDAVKFDFKSGAATQKRLLTLDNSKMLTSLLTDNKLMVFHGGPLSGKNKMIASLHVYDYPSMKILKEYRTDEPDGAIPFKKSNIQDMYGKNFEEHEPKPKMALQILRAPDFYFDVHLTNSGSYLLKLAEQKFKTQSAPGAPGNAFGPVTVSVRYGTTFLSDVEFYYGCLNSQFEPCEDPIEKSPYRVAEEMFVSMRKELGKDETMPVYTRNRGSIFTTSVIKKTREIVIHEFK